MCVDLLKVRKHAWKLNGFWRRRAHEHENKVKLKSVFILLFCLYWALYFLSFFLSADGIILKCYCFIV